MVAIFVELSSELCVAAVVAVLIVPLKSPEKVVAVAVHPRFNAPAWTVAPAS